MKRRLVLTAISIVVLLVTMFVTGDAQCAEAKFTTDLVDLSQAGNETGHESLHHVPITTLTTKLKRNCGIPDSIPWGHYKIFLYQKGIDAEFARKDSVINHWRDSVKIARGL